MSGFLLDTNVISELIKPRPDANVTHWLFELDEELFYLSVLSLGEIRKGIEIQPQPARRVALESWLERELRPRFNERILPITYEIAERWGTLAGKAKTRDTPMPVIDGLLAATALEHNLTLVTRNVSDMTGTGVALFDPWTAKEH